MGPKELKELVVMLRELSASYEEMGNTMKGVVNETKFLKRLIGEPDPRAQHSRLIAAGIALIAFPDPTITDFIGAILVAAGLIKNRMGQITVVDVRREFQEAIGKVENITREPIY